MGTPVWSVAARMSTRDDLPALSVAVRDPVSGRRSLRCWTIGQQTSDPPKDSLEGSEQPTHSVPGLLGARRRPVSFIPKWVVNQCYPSPDLELINRKIIRPPQGRPSRSKQGVTAELPLRRRSHPLVTSNSPGSDHEPVRTGLCSANVPTAARPGNGLTVAPIEPGEAAARSR